MLTLMRTSSVALTTSVSYLSVLSLMEFLIPTDSSVTLMMLHWESWLMDSKYLSAGQMQHVGQSSPLISTCHPLKELTSITSSPSFSSLAPDPPTTCCLTSIH